MSHTTSDIADAHSHPFLGAVTELAERRSVLTTRAVVNIEGETLLGPGVPIEAGHYDLLASQRLAGHLDECLGLESMVTAADLTEAAVAAIARLPFFAALAPAGAARESLLQVIGSIPLPPPVAFQLTLVREIDREQFDHSVVMALLCAFLIGEGQATAHDQTAAAAAGLLHDLGMLHIDPQFLQAGTKLKGDQRRPLYMHPIRSAMFVERFPEYPDQVRRAIIEHHEQLDGSGYPRGLSGGAISPLGLVLSLAEVVTAMFNGHRKHPEQRISLMLRVSPRRFDPAAVATIKRVLQSLPAPLDEPGLVVSASVERLQLLAGLLTQWHDALDQSSTHLDAPGLAVLCSISEQAETLQRVLYESGFTEDQLGMLTRDAENDPVLRVELWALSEELQWHLLSSANQLQRRWQDAGSEQPYPAVLAGWLETFQALT